MAVLPGHLGLWFQLACATGIILAGAHFLTRAADAISIRTGIGHSFIGVVLLATATSLPELGTGISSIQLNQPDLAMGAAFGSNMFNLLLIPLIDLYWRRGPILAMVHDTSKLIAWLGIAVIALGVFAVLAPEMAPILTRGRLSPLTWLIFAAFWVAMYILYRRSTVGDEKQAEAKQDTLALPAAVGLYSAAALTVVAGAVWLARVGDSLAVTYHWDASFVGTQFLALCTSLPELATSFAALRIGAPALAVSNVLGSNLFNMGFVIYFNDLAYPDSIWPAISNVHAFTGAVAILMTLITIAAMRFRQSQLRSRGFEPDNAPTTYGPRAGYAEAVSLVAIYLIASVIVFHMG